MEKTSVRLKDVCRAFRVGPAQLWVLEARGDLPERPPRTITAAWLRALVQWFRSVRGELPPEANQLMKAAGVA